MTKRFDLVSTIPKLRRYGLALTINSADADDLLQATLERALSRERQFRGEYLSGWLCSIMRSIWFNEVKSRKRFADSLDIIRVTGEPYLEPDICLQMNDVDRLLVKEPRLTREIVILCWIFGCTYKETANMLKTDLSTVRNRLNRFRAKVSSSLLEAEAQTETVAHLHMKGATSSE